jgi:hypothetical protein
VNRRRESIRAVRKTVKEHLITPDFKEALKKLLQIPAGQVTNSLFYFLYHEDPVIKWHAVSAIGAVVANLALEDMEAARIVIRRLMWNLNDESGGIGWGSPEAMGEILACNEKLALEYWPILLSYAREDGNFQEHELMQRGVLWGIGRLSKERPELLKESAPPHIIPYLNSGDADVRGLAAWITGLLGSDEARLVLEGLRDDESRILIYMEGIFVEYQVKDLAEQALDSINAL